MRLVFAFFALSFGVVSALGEFHSEEEAVDSTPSCNAGSAPVLLLQHNATIGKKIREQKNVSLDECSEQCSLAHVCVPVP